MSPIVLLHPFRVNRLRADRLLANHKRKFGIGIRRRVYPAVPTSALISADLPVVPQIEPVGMHTGSIRIPNGSRT